MCGQLLYHPPTHLNEARAIDLAVGHPRLRIIGVHERESSGDLFGELVDTQLRHIRGRPEFEADQHGLGRLAY